MKECKKAGAINLTGLTQLLGQLERLGSATAPEDRPSFVVVSNVPRPPEPAVEPPPGPPPGPPPAADVGPGSTIPAQVGLPADPGPAPADDVEGPLTIPQEAWTPLGDGARLGGQQPGVLEAPLDTPDPWRRF
jgi:hypothetical protein